MVLGSMRNASLRHLKLSTHRSKQENTKNQVRDRELANMRVLPACERRRGKERLKRVGYLARYCQRARKSSEKGDNSRNVPAWG